MRTSKISNSLIDKLAESASLSQPKKSNKFNEIVLEFTKTKSPTLNDIFAQIDMSATPAVPPATDINTVPPVDSNPIDNESAKPPVDTENIKKNLIDALIALCGDAEAAKQCIDSHNTDAATTDNAMEPLPDSTSPTGENVSPLPPEAAPV